MNSNNVRFVHARRPLHNVTSGHYMRSNEYTNAKGGLSAAWVIGEDGTLTVAQPAICSRDDHFVRKTGARMAKENMDAGKNLFVFTKAYMIDQAIAGYKENLTDAAFVSPKGVDQMVLDFQNMLRNGNPSEFLNASFFEALVRENLDRVYNTDAKRVYAI